MSNKAIFKAGILGKKLGMSHIFAEDGQVVPVTVIEAGPCYVLQVCDAQKHGYSAVQLGFDPKRMDRCDKATQGHFAKSEKGAFYHVREMRCDVEALGWNTLGKEIRVEEIFKGGETVDVSGVSIGRGFSGVVRRYRQKGQPSTRGTHEVRRHPGAIGNRKFPGHVFKNKKMPGQMGDANVTIQNLKVVGVRPEENIILIRGAVPGSRGGLVVVRKAQKIDENKTAA